MEIRRLLKSDKRNQFDCGSEELNRFLREFALQNQEKRASVTFVAVEAGESVVCGYVTVCAGSLSSQVLPGRLGRGLSCQPQPVLQVARLGVDQTAQDQGIGASLLVRAYRQALAQTEASGCIGVVVDAKPEAENFYRKQGFVPLELVESLGVMSSMFLPVSMIEDAFSPPLDDAG